MSSTKQRAEQVSDMVKGENLQENIKKH